MFSFTVETPGATPVAFSINNTNTEDDVKALLDVHIHQDNSIVQNVTRVSHGLAHRRDGR